MLLARPPLMPHPKVLHPFDLNVLCTPPALILSQDQTLYILLLYRCFRSPANFVRTPSSARYNLIRAFPLPSSSPRPLASRQLFLCKVTCFSRTPPRASPFPGSSGIDRNCSLLRFPSISRLSPPFLSLGFSLFNFQGSLASLFALRSLPLALPFALWDSFSIVSYILWCCQVVFLFFFNFVNTHIFSIILAAKIVHIV